MLNDKSEQDDQELGNQNDCDQRDRIGCGISSGNILRACGGDQGSECGGTRHTARERAETVQKAELQNVFCEQITKDHGNDGHDDTVNEVHRVKVLYKFRAAGDTCANKEEHETKLSEKRQSTLCRHNADLTETAEVTEDQADEQTAARGCKREASTAEPLRGKRDFDLTDERTENCRKGECRDTHMVNFKKLADKGFLFFFRFDNELCSFNFHIGFRQLGNQLYEEYDADYAEDVSNTVANGNETHVLRLNRCFRSGERGCGGQGAGKQTDDHRNEAVLCLNGGAVADHLAQTDTSGSGKTARKNNDHAEKNVGFEVSLKVAEEFRTRDITDGGNEENQTEAFQERKTCFKIVVSGGSGEKKIARPFVHVEEQCAEEQSDDENACITERNALDRDSSEEISEKKNRENHEKQRGNITDRNNAVK